MLFQFVYNGLFPLGGYRFIFLDFDFVLFLVCMRGDMCLRALAMSRLFFRLVV
jgi:hypothetical protein